MSPEPRSALEPKATGAAVFIDGRFRVYEMFFRFTGYRLLGTLRSSGHLLLRLPIPARCFLLHGD